MSILPGTLITRCFISLSLSAISIAKCGKVFRPLRAQRLRTMVFLSFFSSRIGAASTDDTGSAYVTSNISSPPSHDASLQS